MTPSLDFLQFIYLRSIFALEIFQIFHLIIKLLIWISLKSPKI